MILVLEGIDASGKCSQAKALKEKFTSLDLFDRVESFDFPHYTGIAGQQVCRILTAQTKITDAKGEPSARDHALLLQCAMLADRMEFATKLKEFECGDSMDGNPDDLLILDRYFLSGICYGQADGLDRKWLFDTHSILPQPDRIYILDVPVEESVKRRPARRDYYEKNLDKLNHIRHLYREEAACDPVGIKVIDGMQPMAAVTDQIAQDFVYYRANS